jgi:hypothetical protein
MCRFALALLATAVVASAAAVPAVAQVAILDEGTFSHSVGGTRIGREDFSIRATRSAAPGGSFVAQANVLEGENRRTIVLNTDSLGGPLRFQLEAREATRIVSSVVGERDRATWLGRVVAGERETGREFRLAESTLIAEPGVAHHLWFILRFGQGRPVALLTPSASAVDSVRLFGIGSDSVQVGARMLPARRWELRGASDDRLRWEFWADAAGRILRARHAESGLEALRDDPPVETPLR